MLALDQGTQAPPDLGVVDDLAEAFRARAISEERYHQCRVAGRGAGLGSVVRL